MTRRLPLLGLAALALGLTSCIGVLKTSGDELATHFEDLEVPDHWELVEEEIVNAPCNITDTCPRAARIYEVDSSNLGEEAVDIVQSAGLQITLEPTPSCDPPDRGCTVIGHDTEIAISIVAIEAQNGRLTMSIRVVAYAGS